MLAGTGDDLDLAARHWETVGLIIASELYGGRARPQSLEKHLTIHSDDGEMLETFWKE